MLRSISSVEMRIGGLVAREDHALCNGLKMIAPFNGAILVENS
jgi:hypothetical protein